MGAENLNGVADANRRSIGLVGNVRVDHQAEGVVEAVAVGPVGHGRFALADERLPELRRLLTGVGVAARNHAALAGVDAVDGGVTDLEADDLALVGEQLVLPERRDAAEFEVGAEAPPGRLDVEVEPGGDLRSVAVETTDGPWRSRSSCWPLPSQRTLTWRSKYSESQRFRSPWTSRSVAGFSPERPS